MASKTGVSGIILAGGRSRRLGIDKTTMPWPPAQGQGSGVKGQGAGQGSGVGDQGSGLRAQGQGAAGGARAVAQTLLQTTAAKLAQVCDEIVLVGYRGAVPVPYRVVPDAYPEGGSLGGIYSGLAAATDEYGLAVATDMPFLSLPLLRWMLAQPRDFDALVPVRDEPEPLHAVYAKSCLEPMRRRLEAGRLKIAGFFDEVRVRYVDAATLAAYDPEGLSFFNINTPDDLERARLLYASGAQWADSVAGP